MGQVIIDVVIGILVVLVISWFMGVIFGGYRHGCGAGAGELADSVQRPDGGDEVSDNSFLPGLAAFARSLGEHDTPFLNEIKKGPAREGPPIIGYTKDRRHGLQHVFRIGERVRLRVARLVPVEVCDDDGGCVQYWQRNQWEWLWTVAIKAARRAPKPIYDPDWVDPNPTTMTWGVRDFDVDESFSRLWPKFEHGVRYLGGE